MKLFRPSLVSGAIAVGLFALLYWAIDLIDRI